MNLFDWFEAHPVFTTAVVVPLIVGTVNQLLRPRTPEQYALLPPRIAAFLKFLRAWFPDTGRASEAAVQVITGRALTPDEVRRLHAEKGKPQP